MKVIGIIADHPTPKIKVGEEIAFTQNSRDYKGVMVIVISENNQSANDKYPSRDLQRTGRIQRHVGNEQ